MPGLGPKPVNLRASKTVSIADRSNRALIQELRGPARPARDLARNKSKRRMILSMATQQTPPIGPTVARVSGDLGRNLISLSMRHTMMDSSRTSRFAPTLVFTLFAMIAVAPPSPAAAEGGGEPNSAGTLSRFCGHKFEPGPIVNGHSRQPTPAEFSARMRQLHALSEGAFDVPAQGQAGTCRPD